MGPPHQRHLLAMRSSSSEARSPLRSKILYFGSNARDLPGAGIDRWLGQVEALGHVATELQQNVELLFGLDPLGHCANVQRSQNLKHRTDRRLGDDVAADLGNEKSVELHNI